MKFLDILKINTSSSRNFGLDLLRAIAILMVMLLHGKSFLSPSLEKPLSFLLIDGVSIFFVLSGFLIGGIFIKELNKIEKRQSNVRFLFNFLSRRWFRTIPNYYLALILIILYFIWQGHNLSQFDLYKYFLFIQNFENPHPTFYPEAWSLSIEEWFYLIVPFLILLIYNLFKNTNIPVSVLTVSVFIVIFCIILRYIKFLNFGVTDDFELNYKKIVIYRLDSIMYGVLAAYFLAYHPIKWEKFKNPMAVIGSILLAGQHLFILLDDPSPFYLTNLSIPIEAISIMLLLPYIYSLRSGNAKFTYIITHISIISYSMYLFNYSLIKYGVMELINWDYLYSLIEKFSKAHVLIWVVQYLMFWILTLLLSTLNYKYFEFPILKLRDRITKK